MVRYYISFVLLIIITGCAQSNYSKYAPIYDKVTLADIPDYSKLEYWAAHPNKRNPSDSIPRDIKTSVASSKDVDVFFLYPTSYLDRNMPYGWSAPLKENKINIYTDFSAILYQASVFNEVGKIYAPRYRQANIMAYYPVTSEDTTKALAAFDLAYQDVKNAFEYYLSHYNNGRPIIIASHSQGSTHSIRLLKEYFDGKPLAKQLVAAYVVGMAINPANYTSLKACEKPNETGCICAWRTFMEGFQEPFVDKENFNSIVTNPLSWDNQNVKISRDQNPGSLLYNFNKISPQVAGAINHNGVLWTPKPHFFGNFLIKTKNYHIADYNLYYVSIRKNAALRVTNFFEKQKGNYTN